MNNLLDKYEIGDIITCKNGFEWIVDIDLETNTKFWVKVNEDKDPIDEFIVKDDIKVKVNVLDVIKRSQRALKSCITKYCKKIPIKTELDDNLEQEVYEEEKQKIFKYKLKPRKNN
jgi:hypothetical protein